MKEVVHRYFDLAARASEPVLAIGLFVSLPLIMLTNSYRNHRPEPQMSIQRYYDPVTERMVPSLEEIAKSEEKN